MSPKPPRDQPLLPGFDGEDASQLLPAVPRASKTEAASTEQGSAAEDTRIVAGIDEAGLGPMLGPLTMGFCAMRVPRAAPPLWELLAEVVAQTPKQARGRLVVADSKVVFTRNKVGHERLERTALAFLAQRPCGPPTCGGDLIASAPPGTRPDPALLSRHPWYGELPAALPIWCEPERTAMDASSLAQCLRARGAHVLDAGMRIVPAGELNASYDRTGNKGATVWQHTVALIAHLWKRHSSEGLSLVVDRQGGRFRYLQPLKAHFPGVQIETLQETPPLSEYVLRAPAQDRSSPEGRMLLRFAERAEERSFPVALASCFAKYARETCMESFNSYFNQLQSELRPTAGYVTDARRWLQDAEPALQKAGLEKRVLVRER